MKHNKILILFLAVLLMASSCKGKKTLKIFLSLAQLITKVDSVLSLMTLKEKIGQMTQINLTVIAKGPNKWASNDTSEISKGKSHC